MPSLRFAVVVPLALAACSSAPDRIEPPGIETGVVPDAGDTCYEVAGSGPAVVLIHGGFGDRRMWDDHFLPLAEDHLVVRYDLRGFGRTPAPRAEYSPVDDLRQLLDALDVERATLVGNSMGGALAIDFALVHPQRVEGLVTVASGLSGFPGTPEERAPYKAEFDELNAAFARAQSEGPESGIELWLASPMVVVASRATGTAARLRRMITENTGIFTIDHWPFEKLDPPAARRLSEVRAPTLVVAGGRDTPLMRDVSARIARGIPGARLLVIEEADHLPQMVAPAEFRAALDELLARVESAR